MAAAACGDDELPARCTPQIIGPEASFAALRDPSSPRITLARRVADHFVASHDPRKMAWDWAEAVGMLGLVDLYRLSGETRYRDFYRDYIDHWLAADWRKLITSSDRCPPALAALALYRESCGEGYRAVVDAVLHFLDHEALRSADGGINHLGINDLFGISLWLDSLFMFGNLWLRWAEHTGESAWLDRFRSQYLVFTGHLQSDAGLMEHAHGWTGTSEPELYWARGNAWVTAVGYDYLRVRRLLGGDDPEVQASLERQVAAVIATQDANSGLWWTVLDRPGETYLETSASALFVTGLVRGFREGFLGEQVLAVVESALAGLETRVAGDGTVSGTSGPTSVGAFEDYAAIGVEDDLPYGVGAVLLALIESSSLG